jgi:hypothetical protein
MAEKIKSFIDRLEEDGEKFGSGFAFATNKACQTCLFAHGEYGNPPKSYTPRKCYCQIYDYDEGEDKPRAIAYDGAPCEYYEKD